MITKEELVKSIKLGEFTNELEVACIETIEKLFNKYPYIKQEWYVPEYRDIIEKSALETCKKLSLKFNPDRSDNAFAYIVQIIKSDFAKTTLQLMKQYKNR